MLYKVIGMILERNWNRDIVEVLFLITYVAIIVGNYIRITV